jgi:hypothetical protein
MTTVSLRFPVDVIEDAEKAAAYRGYSGYQSLLRSYIGSGLRQDLIQMERNRAKIETP